MTNYTISGIPNDGTPTTVTIVFTDSLSCTSTVVVNPPVLPTVTGISGGAIYCEGYAVTNIQATVTGTGPFVLDYTLDGVANTVNSALSPCLLYTSPSPRDRTRSRMPSSA